jgi:hypothetical protein
MAVLLVDLKLILPDMLGKKLPLFEATNTGKTYIPLLQAQLKAIDELPASVQEGTPLAAELAETDAEHDGYGGAVWHITEAYQRCPGASDKVRAAAARVRAQFIPALQELQSSFADEAHRARDRRALLSNYKEDLKLFPIAEGGTLHDWVSAYLDAGLALNALLSDRADTSIDSRAGAGALRTATLGILSRMRGALADEVQASKKLPRDLETQVFAYFDQLSAQRPAPKKRGKKTSPETPPQDAPPDASELKG